MKSRDVLGKRIVAVRHSRYPGNVENGDAPFVYVSELELEDGTILRTHAIEVPYDQIGDLIVVNGTVGSKNARATA